MRRKIRTTNQESDQKQADTAALFNDFNKEFRGRIDSLIKSVFIICGGILSITIGAFLAKDSPQLSIASIGSIQTSWIALSASIIGSLLTMFLLIIAQAQTSEQMKKRIESKNTRLTVHKNPLWLRVLIWSVGIISFILCIFGLAVIAYAAGQLITIKP